MVVDYLDAPGVTIAPHEADTPLIVDANRVLAVAVAAQGLQAIAGRRAQIIEQDGRIDGQELRSRARLNLRRQTANGVASEDGRGPLVGEASDHDPGA